MIIMGHFQLEMFHDSICNRAPNAFTTGKELLNKERKPVSLSQSSLAANCWKPEGYNQRYHCIFHPSFTPPSSCTQCAQTHPQVGTLIDAIHTEQFH